VGERPISGRVEGLRLPIMLPNSTVRLGIGRMGGVALAQGRCGRAVALAWRRALLVEIKHGETRHEYRLGPDWHKGDHPHVAVLAHAWQSARSLGAWTLVGCTVAPGFDFSGLELAPDDWTP
jgi:hypothetical protein